MTTYTMGDTIRLKATFTTWAGVATDPTTPALKIYDESETVILTKTATDLTKSATGVYYYDYTTTAKGLYYYEFSGTLESTVELERAEFYVEFVGID